MIREHEVLVLARDLPEFGLKAGDLGAVVLVHPGAGCEVEFMTPDGETLAAVSLSTDQFGSIRGREISHAQPIG